MFIGSVIMGMVDSTADMIKDKKLKVKAERKKMITQEILRFTDERSIRNMDRSMKRTVRLIKLVFTGRSISISRLKVSMTKNGLRVKKKRSSLNKLADRIFLAYIEVVDFCGALAENAYFQNLITFVIIVASAEVGLQTDLVLSKKIEFISTYLDEVILVVFTFEVVVKMIAEGTVVWAYFYNNWNKFDFFIVVVSYAFSGGGNGNLIMMLRLLRLLRVLKLLRAFPKLQVIVSAILSSISSIFYIGIIIVIFFYFYAIVGMILFADNDPWHFSTLHRAMLTLFQGVTFDNWTPVLLTNAYGCFAPVWLYQSWVDGCDTTQTGSFAFTELYFISFDLIGGYILLSLFIGVVNVYMDMTNHELDKEKMVDIKVKKVADDNEIDNYTVNLYKEVFKLIDFSKSGYLGSDELKFGLTIAGNNVTEDEFKELKYKVDKNNDNKIDFSEFLTFALDLKFQRRPVKLQRKHERQIKHKSYGMIDTTDMTDQEKIEALQDLRASADLGPTDDDLLIGDYIDIGGDPGHDFALDKKDEQADNNREFSQILKSVRYHIDMLDKTREEFPDKFPIWSPPAGVGNYSWNGQPATAPAPLVIQVPVPVPVPFGSPPSMLFRGPEHDTPPDGTPTTVPYSQMYNNTSPQPFPGFYPGMPVYGYSPSGPTSMPYGQHPMVNPYANALLSPQSASRSYDQDEQSAAAMKHHVQMNLLTPVTKGGSPGSSPHQGDQQLASRSPPSPSPWARKPCKSLICSI
jgi:voltage-gated sodium channel